MKRKVAVMLAIASVMAMQSGAYAQNDVAVIVNGETVEFDQPPVIEDNRTLVPFRAVLEKMGAEVGWDNATQTVTCSLDGKEVSLVINSDKMQTPNGEITLDVPAKIINERTMVPIRAISEGLGAIVAWDAETRTVTVTTQETPEDETPIKQLEPTYSLAESTTEVKQDDTVAFTINVSYPVIEGEAAGIDAINAAIAADAQARVAAYEENEGESAKEFVQSGQETSSEWSCDIDYEVKYLDNSIVSMYITEVSYMGGAHPNTVPRGLTFDMQTGKRMSADDFMENALEEGKAGIKALAEAEPDSYPFYDDASFELTEDDWYIENSQIVFIVPPYEIAPYAAGIIEYRLDLGGI